ncbi:hypothetical protein GCM10010104_52320 [Streptomyces indiaensis]|uniref:Uncharacterized protein n=1 Tax=Streptomyces indiaensis TaxID=284033 RepID=A0ABN3E5Z0_9ACTN
MTSVPHAEHGTEELCPGGAALYEWALHEGHVSAEAAQPRRACWTSGTPWPPSSSKGTPTPSSPSGWG